jgi:hypothetical protein
VGGILFFSLKCLKNNILVNFEALLSALKWPLTALIWHKNGVFGRFLVRIGVAAIDGFMVSVC